jgi:hypothetical protein
MRPERARSMMRPSRLPSRPISLISSSLKVKSKIAAFNFNRSTGSRS